ncbi:adenylyl-sulfate kinase [Jannaschia donghaensis]|uniref:Putative adenylyl-sulfate kinase n=1 Tax=Jannaschia donghaensis TaxID=420998 RepID=A0A0M6YG10_9RHOB|nr:adenylyl-sulfate kinase [Jannaschia donghaensis]CTQ48874.1 putative adenylyl-sulfate kinase [Jannaschia donghaensis]
MVIWIIGLSGAGKTTLADAVVATARSGGAAVVLVDGDVIRETFGNDLGHSLEDRRRNAERIMRLCRWLDSQGVHVVCAILSLFPEHRKWMRENVKAYHEVYIDAPLHQLQARDVKGLYARYATGQTQQVAGLDLEFPEPEFPDTLIRNDGSETGLLDHATPLARLLMPA